MYEPTQYERLIEKTSRGPLPPKVGHPLFAALLAIALLAKSVLGAEYAGLALLLLLFLYPYYLVQLLMRARMQKHLAFAQKVGVWPSYVPSNMRSWAAVYIGGFFATGVVVLGADKLLVAWVA
ncbi:hypothetical protein [Polaromonas sp.]|uniref:hypothetical protein n=1 Tax=Polaromonas sp. TaxID=1869339 RepID=UPI00326763A4